MGHVRNRHVFRSRVGTHRIWGGEALSEEICLHCNGPIAIRNPSGSCDHLYYPENCQVCRARSDRWFLTTDTHFNVNVLQDWLNHISWKKQTILLGVIRAPDTVTTLNLKRVTVWLRMHVLRNADPMTGFMHHGLETLPLFEQIDREFERLPLHVAHHIMLAMQVIGTEHPNGEISQTAWKFYTDAVRAQHLNPETNDQYEARYVDNPARMESMS